MRKAYQDNGIIVVDDKFIGIALGYDYCAEHECGIKDLRRICGMPEKSKKNMGVVNRTITIVPVIVFKEEHIKRDTKKVKKGKYAILYTGYRWRSKEENESSLPRDLKNFIEELSWNVRYKTENPEYRKDKDNILTAWDEGGFGVAVFGEKEVQWLKELKTAIEEKRLTIAVADLRARNPFSGSSLCLMITNRIPQETLDAMYMGDKEYFDREDYEKKIGMKKILEKNHERRYSKKNHNFFTNLLNKNKKDYSYGHDHGYYMACSPKWIDYNNEEGILEEQKKSYNTKYDIIYWVNYSDNDDTHAWCRVEDIKEWLTGKKKLSEIIKSNVK